MNKILRFSLVSLLTLFFGTTFAQTTFDFDNDYQSLFPTLPGTSSGDSNDGDFTEPTTCTLNGISVTVSAADEGVSNANRIWTNTPRLRMYSGTLTVTAPEGKNLSSIEFVNGKWNAGNTASAGTLDGANWTGLANSVVISIGGNTQINSITVYLEGETPQPVEKAVYKKAAEVEHFKKYLLVAENEGTENEVIKLVDKKVWRNYNIFRDGELVIDHIVAKLSENAFNELKAAGGILYLGDKELTNGFPYDATMIYTIKFNGLPLVSCNWARPNKSARSIIMVLALDTSRPFSMMVEHKSRLKRW